MTLGFEARAEEGYSHCPRGGDLRPHSFFAKVSLAAAAPAMAAW
ncbi:hypothetical protein BCO37747_03345 [Burkholderia contaminans]|jgi:hypothetical protein|nr:hypothetical protein BCO23253_03806 [Burkholderia contaminans]VWD12822.1 hypothetical protein BCO37747_03345 [Burkholderia contaminans]